MLHLDKILIKSYKTNNRYKNAIGFRLYLHYTIIFIAPNNTYELPKFCMGLLKILVILFRRYVVDKDMNTLPICNII